MACKTNEVGIRKGVIVKLDSENVMILADMVHTATKEAKTNGTDKSWYRYEGRVLKTADLNAEIADMKTDAKCLLAWKWPSKFEWNDGLFLAGSCGDGNKAGAKWYASRLKRALTWDEFMNLAKNGIKKTAKGEKQSDVQKYPLDEYVDDAGNAMTIDTPENMLKLVGHTFTKKMVLKRDLPK